MLSNPLYLFALMGLIIPIAIHLLSRKEGKIIKLGSIRHVLETSTQQFKGIKLNEIVLLMLRCAMLIVFALLLSGLQCSNQRINKWVMIEKGLEQLPNLPSILDSLEKDGYSLHLLAKGFADLKDSSGRNSEINYWQLVEELKQKNLSEAIVFSKNNIENFKGIRPALPANVRWISQPLPSLDFPLKAIHHGRDSAFLLMGHTNIDKTYFSTKKITTNASPIAVTAQDTIKIVLVSDADYDYDHKIVTAALLAIEKFTTTKILLTEADPSNAVSSSTDWCVWLSAKKPEEINAKNIIRIDPQMSSDLIVQTKLNHWAITKRLNQEIALHNNLTMQLAILLLPEKNLEQKINRYDRRMVSDSLAWSHFGGAKEIQASIQHEPANRNLIILLLVLLIVERILAYKRNQ